MTTLTPTAARANLSNLLRRALKGDDIGIVFDGRIVALRPVAVESVDYAEREYGVTREELDSFEKKSAWQNRKTPQRRKAPRVHRRHRSPPYAQGSPLIF